LFKTIAAVLFAAVIIEVGAGAQSATGMIEENRPQRALKGDRLIPRRIEPACAQAGWPHYESRCVRSQPGAPSREVRIVAIDVLPSKDL
jgi:hypothetical protein